MFCIIAAERELAQVIVKNLKKNDLYKGWEFDVCHEAGKLEMWSRENPDVLVLSRFLPGEDPFRLLGRLGALFSATHVVLLAGPQSEHQRAYIKAAQKAGMCNIVTGKLPGDRPYTIFAALKSPKDHGLYAILDERQELPLEPMKEDENGVSEGENLKSALEEIVRETVNRSDSKAIEDKLQEIINMLSSGTPKGLSRVSRTNRGILVITRATWARPPSRSRWGSPWQGRESPPRWRTSTWARRMSQACSG